MRIEFFIVIVIITVSCSSRKESNETYTLQVSELDTVQVHRNPDSVILIENDDFDYGKASMIESYLVDNADSKETTEIKSKCAVYVFPDHETLEAMQKKYGQDYYTIADDANWYFSESSRLLDSLEVKQESIKTRYVRCFSGGTSYTIDYFDLPVKP
jgi:hypothetical protein